MWPDAKVTPPPQQAKPRRIVQLAPGAAAGHVFALADDGTLWKLCGTLEWWVRMPDLPPIPPKP